MTEPIISVKDIGKKYNITHQRGKYIALRDVIANVMSNPFAFLKKKTIAGVKGGSREDFWALKDVNFEVHKGEIVGIIGSNGAGKSTLLKILSQITPPTTGEIKIQGRVGSLLEVGTGFHPELTGRENVFLNGAILGMTEKEIAKKFDDIVKFSGIEQFLDTPVKRYSSGMYVRLAFSVAAHMEPDILVIDEVLAVGDAEFQKKCMGKMEEITNKDGRTILFVSHNMSAIKTLCTKTILLEKGQVKKIGKTNEVIQYYLDGLVGNTSERMVDIGRTRRKGTGWLKIKSAYFCNSKGDKVSAFKSGEDAVICITYDYDGTTKKEFDFSLAIDSLAIQNRIAFLDTKILRKALTPQKDGVIKIHIKKLPLNVGTYQVDTQVTAPGELVDWVGKTFVFSVVKGGDFYGTGELPLEVDGDTLLDYEIKQDN